MVALPEQMVHSTLAILVVAATEHKVVQSTALLVAVDYVALEDQSAMVSVMSPVVEPWVQPAEQMPASKSVELKLEVPRSEA